MVLRVLRVPVPHSFLTTNHRSSGAIGRFPTLNCLWSCWRNYIKAALILDKLLRLSIASRLVRRQQQLFRPDEAVPVEDPSLDKPFISHDQFSCSFSQASACQFCTMKNTLLEWMRDLTLPRWEPITHSNLKFKSLLVVEIIILVCQPFVLASQNAIRSAVWWFFEWVSVPFLYIVLQSYIASFFLRPYLYSKWFSAQ